MRMASFQKRGKTWQYTISRMINGKSKPIRKGGFKTKKEAQIAAAEIEAKLHKGINVNTRLIPLDEYFEQWVELYKSNVREGTKTHYQNTLRIIKEYFPNTPIQHITKNDYQAFINHFGKDKVRETVKKVNSQIRSCVKDAVDEGIINVDFTRNVVLSGGKGKRAEEKYLNYEESQLLLSALYKRLSYDRLVYYLILLALTSGMRFGELVGLTRKDFNFLNNTITVNKTWGYLPTTEQGVKDTKTIYSNRVIKMDKRTMKTFKDLFNNTPENIHRVVFYNPASKYKVFSNTGVNKALKKLQIEIGISQPISLHGLRHTHASVLLYKGVSIQYISERLGHADIDTTLKKYAHMIKELRKKDEEKAISIFEAM
jgi:integrase